MIDSPSPVQTGDHIAFLGASVTEADPGFSRLFAAMAQALAPQLALRFTFAGRRGDRVSDLLERVDRDVLLHRPDWVVVQTPTNDLRSAAADLSMVEAAYRALLDRLLSAGARVVVLPPPLITEELESPSHARLRRYGARARTLAESVGARVVPVDVAFEAALPLRRKALGLPPEGHAGLLTTDGVHPNAVGNALFAVVLAQALGLPGIPTDGPPLTHGASLLFLGDSITAADPGYTRLFGSLLAALHPERNVRFHYAGVSGNRVGDLLGRLQRDVLSHEPDWVTVSIGVNDVWHRPGGGTSASDFARDDRLLLHRIVDAGVRPVVLTPTVIFEDLGNEKNRELLELVQLEREVAHEVGAAVCDLNTIFRRAIEARRGALPEVDWPMGPDGTTRFYTADGVHMNLAGNALMALSLLQTLAGG